jgi:hypothetical protein
MNCAGKIAEMVAIMREEDLAEIEVRRCLTTVWSGGPARTAGPP